MYNDRDAIARVDSYIVSVTGGGRFVGERKMVRIESVERSTAVASLIGEDLAEAEAEAEADEAAASEDGKEPVESAGSGTRRRRGRRGGRGRARAAASDD